jgi:hypothetical protein
MLALRSRARCLDLLSDHLPVLLAGFFLTATAAFATPSFAPAVLYPAGRDPYAVVVGDFDGDGNADLAAANYQDGEVFVLPGRGDGTFGPPLGSPAGAFPLTLAAADFDGDGILDLAVGNNLSPLGTVSVLLGEGDGTFAPPVAYLTGSQPFAVAVGDLDGDGDADLAAANVSEPDVSVLLNRGDGTFAPAVDYPAGIGPIALVIGDINRDGALDLVVSNFHNAEVHTVSVLLGHGDGTFAPPVAYFAGVAPTDLELGDLDRDGDLDLVVVDSFPVSGSLVVRILPNRGNGSFGPPASYAAGAFPEDVALGDLDGDGDLDLAVANAVSNDVSVLANPGDGTFEAAVGFPAGAFPISVAIGDFDGNGAPDLAVSNLDSDDVAVLLARIGPPRTKEECKGKGWRRFNNPSFRNQGECIRFVTTGR